LPESTLARPAAQALFVHSDLERARTLAMQALRREPGDPEALFVRMEVAAMEADGATVLDAALRLCEAGKTAPADPRVQLAAVRIREGAANTPAFRELIPRVKALLANSQEAWPDLHAALLRAAMDGVPDLNPYAISRAAGILTDWRVVGPVGRRPLGSEDGISHPGDLSASMYQNRVVENFQFPDGNIILPDYLSHHGTFYGAARFASLTAASWQVDVEGPGAVQVYVDGRRVMAAGGERAHHFSTFEASPGPHRVLVEFAASAKPLRVAITPASQQVRPALPSRVSLQELTYLMAVGHYASGDFESAVEQIDAVPSAERSAALQFVLAQSEVQTSAGHLDGSAAWNKLHSLAPSALAADEALAEQALAHRDFPVAVQLASELVSARASHARALEIMAQASTAGHSPLLNEDDVWTRRIAAHPSCATLRGAEKFYREQGKIMRAASMQHKLDGCAPESLDYAVSLSQQGSHSESAEALRQLVAAAPLNREARRMLVRELQLAGEDESAQHAAVEWLRVAPNASDYHRLAAAVEPRIVPETADENPTEAFYTPYRRAVSEIVRESAQSTADGTPEVLLEDHVAIARPDGSVSLYVHTVKRLSSDEKAEQAENITVPQGAHVLDLRLVHADGTTVAVDKAAESSPTMPAPGDAIEEEYVINYMGDGGISEHCEAFQFVFGNLGDQLLHARFIVLTPAEQSDRGVVIATGGAPEMTATVQDGMLERVWDNEASPTRAASSSQAAAGSPIIRVVQEENGWSTPSSAEHQRRIETIHLGPRPEDS